MDINARVPSPLCHIISSLHEKKKKKKEKKEEKKIQPGSRRVKRIETQDRSVGPRGFLISMKIARADPNDNAIPVF